MFIFIQFFLIFLIYNLEIFVCTFIISRRKMCLITLIYNMYSRCNIPFAKLLWSARIILFKRIPHRTGYRSADTLFMQTKTQHLVERRASYGCFCAAQRHAVRLPLTKLQKFKLPAYTLWSGHLLVHTCTSFLSFSQLLSPVSPPFYLLYFCDPRAPRDDKWNPA